jgi:lipopolysaccharide export system permease protein
MKLLDRYIAKHFLVGYLIAFGVLIGLCLTLDLFVNFDEFMENTDIVKTILSYYGPRIALWFRYLAGMILVIAAVFSLARMTKNNELIAVMASGTSLKRILAPILLLSLILTGLLVVDEEWIIPRLAGHLTIERDEIGGPRRYSIWFMNDRFGNLISCREYNPTEQALLEPFVITRSQDPQTKRWTVTSQIQARRAVYDTAREGWTLEDGRRMNVLPEEIEAGSLPPVESVDFLASDLRPSEIPLRRQEGYKSLLNLRQIEALIVSPSIRTSDMAELILQKHSRIVDPIMNLIMLMVALPVLICRDPKDMKSAILISFVTTLGCFIVTFLCKLFATETFGGHTFPEMWVWAPIFIFLPIAFVQIDSMKT